jgi:hypothetical protein
MLIAFINGLKAEKRSIVAASSSMAETLPEATSSACPTPSMNWV